MDKNIRILSTKILSKVLKDALVKEHFDVTEMDFITTRNISFELKEINSNLIFSS